MADLLSQLMEALGLGNPSAGPIAPAAAPGAPTLGGAPPPAGPGILGGPPPKESLLGNALRGLAGSFTAGGGQGGVLGQIGRGLSGGFQAVDQHRQQQAQDQQQKLRDYLLQRQIGQQDAADAQKQKQADMIAKIPPPNGMDPATWANLPDDTKLSLYTQSVAPEKPKHSAAYTEFQDAQAGGYQGTFNDYQNMDANRHRSTTQINIPKAPPTLEERDQQVLLNGDPSTPEYGMAYTRTFLNPHYVQGTDKNGNATVVPIMPVIPQGIRKPTYQGQLPATAPDAPPAAPQPNTGGFGPPGGTQPAPDPNVPVSSAAAPQPTLASDTPQPGPAIVVGGTAKGQTEDARKNLQLYQRAQQQLPIVLQNFDSLATLGNQVAGKVPLVGNAMTSGPAQEANNALLDITASYLYSVSGATANPGEVANLAKTVMPQIGDQAATLKDKKARLQQMVDSIKVRAGVTPSDAAPADGGRSVSGGNAAGGFFPTGAPTKIQDDAGYNALPSGTHFIGPDGIERVKP